MTRTRLAATVPLAAVPGNLIGRDAELDLLLRFLDDAANNGRALLLTGPAGVGRSSLLDAVAGMANADGALVVRAEGVAFEAGIPFAGMSQMLAPLGTVSSGPEFEGPLSSDDMAAAVVGLLKSAAGPRPVVVVLDDLQEMDVRTVEVVAALAGHLAGSRIGLLAAVRSGTGPPIAAYGLPVHVLGPLDDEAAGRLLATRAPELNPAGRERLLFTAQGYPLALEQAAWGRLATPFAPLVAGLPSAGDGSLLRAALATTGDLDVIAGPRMPPPAHLRLAESAGLVRIDIVHRAVVFQHPGAREAVLRAATAAELRQAHATLATRTGRPDYRAWHLSEAAIRPDEDTARLLAQAGDELLGLGDAAEAVTVAITAAELTPAGAARLRRAARAAHLCAAVTGDLAYAGDLLGRQQYGGRESLWAAAAAGYLLLHDDGDLDAVHRLLVEALETAPPGVEPAAAGAAVDALRTACRFAGRPPWLTQLAVLEARHQPGPRTESYTYEPVDAGRVLREGLGQYHAVLARALDGGRYGAAGLAMAAAPLLALDAFAAGRWDEARSLAEYGLQLCDRTDHALASMPSRYALALIAAARGDEEECCEHTGRMLVWAAPRGAGLVHRYAAHARALAALGRGDAEAAYHHASAVTTPGVLARDDDLGHCALPELVEAAVRTHRNAEVAAHVASARAIGQEGLTIAGAAARLDRSSSAAVRFTEALATPDAEQRPFELARVQLAFGEHLRRARATSQARTQLTAALATFRALSAGPWSARAESELRAAGEGIRRADGTELTHQERAVADLASTGSTNRQIAQRLGISHRTVGYHLASAFRKLGVSSRAALDATLRDKD